MPFVFTIRAGYDEHEAEDGTIAPESTNSLDNARLQTAVTVNKLRGGGRPTHFR